MKIWTLLITNVLMFSTFVVTNIKQNNKNSEEEETFFVASLSPYDEPKYKTGVYYSDHGYFTQKDTTYDRMNLGTTWDTNRGAKVKVGIIDTGLKTTHEDFNGTNISTHSYNVYGNNTTITDENSSIHGSVSASCVAAAINGVGGVGIAPDVELYIYKTASTGGFTNTNLKNALRRAIDDHVDVINMSIQGYTTSFQYSYTEDYDGSSQSGTVSASSLSKSTLQSLIDEAHDAGITVVAAAGNYNTTYKSYPAANDNVIAVGSTGLNNGSNKAGFSNGGAWVDLCAPGYVVGPHANSNTSYCITWGTSFSAPLVSGAIALYKAKYPSATPDEIETQLKATCDAVNSSNLGAGKINVANFLNNGPAETWVDASNMTLPASKTLAKGASEKLIPTFTPSNATRQTCYWSSSDTNIVSVDAHGNITGKNNGKANITATSIDGGFVSTCEVTVDYVEAEEITLSPKSFNIDVNASKQLSWTFTPENTTDKTVVFFSDNENIATVSDEGLVTGINPGTTTITIMCSDGPIDTCTVTVNPILVSNISLNKTTLDLQEGHSYSLEATITPNNASNKGVSWSTSDSAIISLSNQTSSSTSVNAVGSVGQKATVTATALDGSGVFKSCEITIIEEPVVDELTLSGFDTSIPLGATFDSSNIVVTAHYSDDTQKIVTPSSYSYSVDTSSLGKKTISATYDGVTGYGYVKVTNNGADVGNDVEEETIPQTPATWTFTAVDGSYSGGLSNTTWTVGGNPLGIETTNNKRGIQWSKSAGSLTLGGFNNQYLITKVSVICSANGTGSTMSVTIGGNAYSTSKSIAESNNQTLNFTGSASGQVVISFTAGSKSTYMKSVTIEYSTYEAGQTFDVSPLEQSKAWSQYFLDITGPICLVGTEDLDHSDALNSVWSELSDEYGYMISLSKHEFVNSSDSVIVEARTRYIHIINRYHLSDFAVDENNTSMMSISIRNMNNNINLVTLLSICISLSAISIAGLSMFMNKKKNDSN